MPSSTAITAPEFSKDAVVSLLKADTMYATTGVALVIAVLGADALSWEPEILRSSLEAKIGYSIPQSVSDRIQAGITLLTSDMFHNDVNTFMYLCSVLSFKPLFSDSFVPPSLSSCNWACTEAKLLEGPVLYQEEGFSEDIQRLVSLLLDQEGLQSAPEALQFATPGKQAAVPDFALDEDFTQEYWETQNETVTKLNRQAIAGLKDLVFQLKALQLRSADSAELGKLVSRVSDLG